MVTRAEERLARNLVGVFEDAHLPQAVALRRWRPSCAASAAPRSSSEGARRRLILEFRATPAILNFVNGVEAAPSLAQPGRRGDFDHTILDQELLPCCARPKMAS